MCATSLTNSSFVKRVSTVIGGCLVTFAGSRGSVMMLSTKLAADGLGMVDVGSREGSTILSFVHALAQKTIKFTFWKQKVSQRAVRPEQSP
jgi:hypothetical protein